MSYYIRNGNTFRVAATAAMDIQDKLPVGNYTIKMDQYENFYLEMIDSFNSPPKLYGDTIDNTKRIITTYLSRTASTGVMLTGEKGSGKTLLAKNIAISASSLNIPTIVINAPWRGDKFNTFIQSIDQECVILFDEFEKVYDSDQQEEVLTLLDGVYPSKKLFIVTCNDKYRVDKHMRNRPGRIYYMLDFEGLAVEFIREYCQENLHNKEHIDNICTISSIFSAFNFDMLKALVEEMNRYNETPQDALRMLNVKQEFDDGGKFDVELKYMGKVITNHSRKDGWEGNPLNPKGFWIGYDNAESGVSEEVAEWEDIKFEPKHLIKVDVPNGSFIFGGDGFTITLTRKKQQYFSYAF
jgi:hypothetical protein